MEAAIFVDMILGFLVGFLGNWVWTLHKRVEELRSADK